MGILSTGLVLPDFMTGRERQIQAAEKQQSSSKLTILSKNPHNAEPVLSSLVDSWITPVENFYIRSHAPNPKIDLKSFRVRVEGLVRKPLNLSLEELQGRFQRTSVIATMTCAGNRRTEHSRIKPVKGVQWSAGAIGNARWNGVRLSDVLKWAGVKESAKHVWFEGLDEIQRKTNVIPFGASIPLTKAFDDTKSMPGAMLCTGMNGKPLTPDHGFPLRTVVPGYIGARSVKWLGRIVVSDRPSPNHYVQHAYKLVPEDNPLLWDEAGPIYPYVLNSVICTPQSNKKIKGRSVTVSGYALAPGRAGRTIARVEVSTNNGRTWKQAKLNSLSREYCWQLWTIEVPINRKIKHLTVRAVDSAGNSQPRTVKWNLKGYLFNAWHKVPVSVE
ncbi:MAG: sulfite oxidase [Planctomycetaceae bacterium]